MSAASFDEHSDERTDAPFEKLAVIGLGLLGGSVALAARRAGVARRIVAAGRRRAPLEQALASGIVDEIGDVEDMVRGADLVVLAAPVGAMAGTLEAAAAHLAEGALVTDVGSVKASLADTLPGLLPPGAEYVGSHPMAGSHEKGVGHARVDLFDGACCVVTPLPSSSAAAVARIGAFWRSLGAHVIERSPATHDDEVAWVSHVPHVLAFAFAHALRSAPAQVGEMAGTGFRDFTRIARSDAELWGEILTSNTKALVRPLEAFRDSLAELCAAIEHADGEAQERFLSQAREALAAAAAHADDRVRARERKKPDPGA